VQTYRVTLVRSNNKIIAVVCCADSARDAAIIAPDSVTYRANEPRAMIVSIKRVDQHAVGA
jgi:hypothetical protein